MKEEIIMAGFGGQGIMSMGKILAHAGMKENKEVSWMPSYGPEMRGGTANCTVIVSDKKIPSPLSSRPDIVVAMNLPSLDKFGDKVKAGGVLFYNSSLINKEFMREDIDVISIPVNDIAQELGDNKVANMIMLGALSGFREVVKMETLKKSLKPVLSERSHKLIPLNKQALNRGIEFINSL